MTGWHVADGGKGHHSAYLPLGHMPARIRRKPVPGRCPQRQVPAGRMPGEEHGPIADQVSADGLPDEGRKRVHRGGDIIERAGPAAATLASTAELRNAHCEPRGRERRRERTCVCPVIGCPPEPSVQEQHQGRRPQARRLSAARRRTHALRRQAHVRDMLRPWSIGDHQVRRRRRPGQHITGCQRASTSHIRPGHPPADHPPAPSQPARSPAGRGHRRPNGPAQRPAQSPPTRIRMKLALPQPTHTHAPPQRLWQTCPGQTMFLS